MRRLFWVSLGAVTGVLLVRRLTRAVEAYTPAGVSRSMADLGDGLRELAAAVREGMAEREQELRIALGVDAGTLDPETAQSLSAPFAAEARRSEAADTDGFRADDPQGHGRAG
jgi:hypothetical protein